MSKEIEKELGIYENIYPTGEKDRYGQCICHAKCKVCNTEVYKSIDRIRKYHSIYNHMDKSEIDDIGIYTKIHESGKKNKSGHKLYFATCSVCNTLVEKPLSELKESNQLCRHKAIRNNDPTDKINDMPIGWINKSKLNIRIYDLWKSMINRTTEKFWEKYPTYKGTTVDSSWRTLSNFVNDIQTLPGYDMWVNNPNQRIMLDKDTLIEGNKHYSKNTCCFITHAESNRDVIRRHPEINKACGQSVAKKYGKKIKAINLDTNESIIFNSQKEAARELNISAAHIWMILSEDEKYISHKTTKSPDGIKWTFEKV